MNVIHMDEKVHMDEVAFPQKGKKQSPGWAISLTILIGVGWLVFLLLWLFFYGYPRQEWEKNVAIILLSVLVLAGSLGTPWGIWALKNQTAQDKKLWESKGFKSRIAVSIIFGFAVFLFLIYWFWYLAQPYSLFQNVVIFIVAFLIVGGILGALWAPWGMRHSSDHGHPDE
jgi:MFS family permease